MAQVSKLFERVRTFAGSFVVLPPQDFQLTALPAVVSVPSTGQGAITVSMTGTSRYTALTTLAVAVLPAGIAATFAAPTLTAGQNTLLTLATGGTTTAGSYALTVSASGLVNGVQTTRSAAFTLQIQALGQTSLTGQVLDEDAKPVKGVVIKLGSLQTTTDDAGIFLLLNPPVRANQLLFIDGGPASSPGKSFPIIPYKATIVAGQANTLAFNNVPVSGFTVLSPVSIMVALPVGAANGPLAVAGAAGTAASPLAFHDLPPSDFHFRAPPATISVTASGGLTIGRGRG